ncbi:MAG: glycosyltransferase [Neisseriaceae bacterium]
MKKKIAFYLNMFLMGGVETSLFEYLSNFNSDDYDLTLIIGIKMYDYEILLQQLPTFVKVIYIIDGKLGKHLYLKHNKKVKFIHKIMSIFTNPIRKFYMQFRLIQLLENYHVVIDYAMGLNKQIDKFGNNKHNNCKKIGFFHFHISSYYTNSPRKQRQLNSQIKYYDNIVVISEKMLQDAVKLFPMYKAKFVLLYNQISFDRIYNMANQIDADIPINHDYILSIGRLDERLKDFTNLIYAYKILKQQFNREEKLYIIGDGKDYLKLSKLISELELEQDIYLLGSKINPFPWLKFSKLFVLSSKTESFGMVLVEAMILGKPVISTDCPNGPHEILYGGQCGKLVPLGDDFTLSKAMNDVLSNSLLAKDLVTSASCKLDRFNIKLNMSRFYSIIN